jgi:hypothetical protein
VAFGWGGLGKGGIDVRCVEEMGVSLGTEGWKVERLFIESIREEVGWDGVREVNTLMILKSGDIGGG